MFCYLLNFNNNIYNRKFGANEIDIIPPEIQNLSKLEEL